MKSKHRGSIISGFLIGFAASLVVALIIAWAINHKSPLSEEEMAQAAENTIPEAMVSQPAPAPEAAPAAAAEEATATVAEAPTESAGSNVGESIYNQTCSACHAMGIAGAPKFGDAQVWGPRIAQGMDTLYSHAINGLTGASGVMPAKGGNPALSDDEVKAAVDYMVDHSQ